MRFICPNVKIGEDKKKQDARKSVAWNVRIERG